MMKIIAPVVITDAMLTSSNATETDYAEWNVATPYAIDAYVIRGSLHKVYRALQATTGAAPESNLTGSTPIWQLVGATNRWKPMDARVGTQAVMANTLTYVLQPGRVDSLSLLNIDASAASIVMKDAPGGSVIYSDTPDLTEPCAPDWDSYFFSEVTRKTDYVITDMPRYANCELTVTLTASGDVALGVLVVGMVTILGDTETSPSIGIKDYSRKETDTFGFETIVQRAYSKRMDLRTALAHEEVDPVARTLARFRATPVVWIGADNIFTSLIVYGFYRDFSVDIAYQSISYCTLSIEGLT